VYFDTWYLYIYLSSTLTEDSEVTFSAFESSSHLYYLSNHSR